MPMDHPRVPGHVIDQHLFAKIIDIFAVFQIIMLVIRCIHIIMICLSIDFIIGTCGLSIFLKNVI